jgi:chaperonin GroES
MKMRPLRDRILVERIEEQEQKVGGIIIPDTAKEKPQQGRVVAVGKGRVNDKGEVFPLDVKEGDTVLFGKYAGTEIKIDGKEYLIVREDEVLGILEGVRELAAV